MSRIIWCITLAYLLFLSCSNEPTEPEVTMIKNVRFEELSFNSVIVAWETETECNGQVEYGLDEKYGTKTNLDSIYVKEHQIILENLSPQLEYHFRTLSRDRNGNIFLSDDYYFITEAGPAYINISGLWVGTERAIKIGNCKIGNQDSVIYSNSLFISVYETGSLDIYDNRYGEYCNWDGIIKSDSTLSCHRGFWVLCYDSLNYCLSEFEGRFTVTSDSLHIHLEGEEEWCPPPQNCRFLIKLDLTKTGDEQIQSKKINTSDKYRFKIPYHY